MSATCLTFDFDGISLWSAMFKTTTPTGVSRGEFDARIAVPRVLEVLGREEVPATFFVPGKTVETWPDVCRSILEAGHEIGHHGHRHIAPVNFDEAEEREELERSLEAMDRHLGGYRPIGYRAPGPDLSVNTTRLLTEFGFTYDTSMSAQDYEPYWCRTGDQVSQDGTVSFGPEIPLVEIPFSFALDDFAQLEFVIGLLEGLADPEKSERMWLADLQYMAEEVPDGVFTMTFHPQAIARGARIRVLEHMIARGRELDIDFRTCRGAAEDWIGRNESSRPPRLQRC